MLPLPPPPARLLGSPAADCQAAIELRPCAARGLSRRLAAAEALDAVLPALPPASWLREAKDEAEAAAKLRRALARATTSGGKSQASLTAATRAPRPSAHSISVAPGDRLTILSLG